MGDAELLHAFQQVDQRKQVVLEIHQRLFDGFADRLIGREMDDPGNILILLEDGERIVIVAQIDLVILDLFSGDLFHAFEYPGGRADIVIDANDFKAVGNQVYNGMGTDIATSAGDKDLLHRLFFILIVIRLIRYWP